MRKCLLILFILNLVACASKREVKNTTQMLDTAFIILHDTTFIQKHDTLFITAKQTEKEAEQQKIVFATGGNYNLKTGEASGVQSVMISKERAKQSEETAKLQQTLTAYKSENDSLQRIIQSLQTFTQTDRETKEITPQTKYLRDSFRAIAIVAIVALLMWIGIKFIG